MGLRRRDKFGIHIVSGSSFLWREGKDSLTFSRLGILLSAIMVRPPVLLDARYIWDTIFSARSAVLCERAARPVGTIVEDQKGL